MTPTDAGQSTAPSADAEFAAFVAEQAAAPAPEPKAPVADAEPVEAAGAEEPQQEAKPDKPAEVEAEKPEPTISKQLEAINKAKRKAEAQIQAERAKLDAQAAKLAEQARQYQELAPKVAEYEKAKARASVDPVAALALLGIPEDQFEEVARQVYAASRNAPAHLKTESAAARRIREQEEANAKAMAEVQRLREEIEQERIAARQERVVAAFLDGVGKAAEKAPLTKKLLNFDPDEAKAELAKTVSALVNGGEEATPERCVAELEARLKARLAAFGLSDAPAPAKAPNTQGREKAARSLGNDLSTSTRPRPATSTPDDDFATFLEDVKAGRIDG